MKIQSILFGLIIFIGCTETKVSKELESYTPAQCILQAIRDSTISPQKQIIGYQFLCNENDTIKKFLFFEENPWRHVDFPISFGNHDKIVIKQGFIPFDLTNSTYQDVKDKFSITTHEQTGDLIPISAWTECRYIAYPSEVLLVNYILSISGATDPISFANHQMIHHESQLKVFLSNGETAYNLISKEYACTGAMLDSTYRVLFLRTLKPHPYDGITGIEIRDIQNDSILFQLEMDSSFIVMEPRLFNHYAVYEVYTYISVNEKDGIRPHQLLVFDISNRKMLKRNYGKDYKFKLEGISNENLIYSYSDYLENDTYSSHTYEKDIFKIADMEVISSLAQVTQTY